jgi:exosortase/archaeosortase family protein
VRAVAEGNIILIDDLQIGVLEACSGLGMLVTFFALSTAVAFVIQRRLRDKLIIFLSAVPIGMLMNLLRITVTGVLHRTAGSDLANLVFHDLAGWLMMPLAQGTLCLDLLFLKHRFIALEPTGPVPVVFHCDDHSAAHRPGPNPPHLPANIDSKPEPSADRSFLEIP